MAVRIAFAADTRSAEKNIRSLDSSVRNIEKSTGNLEKGFRNLTVTLATVAGAAFTASKALGVFDSSTRIGNRIALVTGRTKELSRTMRVLENVSLRTRTSLEDTAQVFSRLAISSQESIKSSVELTETLLKLGKIGGRDLTSINGALIQLSQGLGAGVLRGDELNSVLENLQPLAVAIAKELNTTVGQLKNFGEQGRITSRVVVNAIRNAQQETEKSFGLLNKTFSDVFLNFKSNFIIGASSIVRALRGNGGLTKALFDAGTGFGQFLTNVGIQLRIARNDLYLFRRELKDIFNTLIASSIKTFDRLVDRVERISVSLTSVIKRFQDFGTAIKAVFYDMYIDIVGRSTMPDMVDGVVSESERLYSQGRTPIAAFAEETRKDFSSINTVAVNASSAAVKGVSTAFDALGDASKASYNGVVSLLRGIVIQFNALRSSIADSLAGLRQSYGFRNFLDAILDNANKIIAVIGALTGGFLALTTQYRRLFVGVTASLISNSLLWEEQINGVVRRVASRVGTFLEDFIRPNLADTEKDLVATARSTAGAFIDAFKRGINATIALAFLAIPAGVWASAFVPGLLSAIGTGLQVVAGIQGLSLALETGDDDSLWKNIGRGLDNSATFQLLKTVLSKLADAIGDILRGDNRSGLQGRLESAFDTLAKNLESSIFGLFLVVSSFKSLRAAFGGKGPGGLVGGATLLGQRSGVEAGVGVFSLASAAERAEAKIGDFNSELEALKGQSTRTIERLKEQGATAEQIDKVEREYLANKRKLNEAEAQARRSTRGLRQSYEKLTGAFSDAAVAGIRAFSNLGAATGGAAGGVLGVAKASQIADILELSAGQRFLFTITAGAGGQALGSFLGSYIATAVSSALVFSPYLIKGLAAFAVTWSTRLAVAINAALRTATLAWILFLQPLLTSVMATATAAATAIAGALAPAIVPAALLAGVAGLGVFIGTAIKAGIDEVFGDAFLVDVVEWGVTFANSVGNKIKEWADSFWGSTAAPRSEAQQNLIDRARRVGRAAGGSVYGPGTATSDSIPAMLSNGEFVVNARAASRYRGLLEAINSGKRILGFNKGGLAGSSTGAASNFFEGALDSITEFFASIKDTFEKEGFAGIKDRVIEFFKNLFNDLTASLDSLVGGGKGGAGRRETPVIKSIEELVKSIEVTQGAAFNTTPEALLGALRGNDEALDNLTRLQESLLRLFTARANGDDSLALQNNIRATKEEIAIQTSRLTEILSETNSKFDGLTEAQKQTAEQGLKEARSGVQSNLASLFKGEGGFKDLGIGIGTTIRDTLANSLATSVTNGLFDTEAGLPNIISNGIRSILGNFAAGGEGITRGIGGAIGQSGAVETGKGLLKGAVGKVAGIFGVGGGEEAPTGTAGNPIYTATAPGAENPLAAATGEGGIFAGMFDKLKTTLSGVFEPLKDLFGDLFGQIAKMFTGGGGGGGGGGLGGVIVGALLGAADGGHISGPGTSRSDSIPAMLSNGEFVVNASATRRNLALLHALNNGVKFRGFAEGGLASRTDAVARNSLVNNMGSGSTINFQLEGGFDDRSRRAIKKMISSGELQNALNQSNYNNGGSRDIFRSK